MTQTKLEMKTRIGKILDKGKSINDIIFYSKKMSDFDVAFTLLILRRTKEQKIGFRLANVPTLTAMRGGLSTGKITLARKAGDSDKQVIRIKYQRVFQCILRGKPVICRRGLFFSRLFFVFLNYSSGFTYYFNLLSNCLRINLY